MFRAQSLLRQPRLRTSPGHPRREKRKQTLSRAPRLQRKSNIHPILFRPKHLSRQRRKRHLQTRMPRLFDSEQLERRMLADWHARKRTFAETERIKLQITCQNQPNSDLLFRKHDGTEYPQTVASHHDYQKYEKTPFIHWTPTTVSGKIIFQHPALWTTRNFEIFHLKGSWRRENAARPPIARPNRSLLVLSSRLHGNGRHIAVPHRKI